MQISRRSSIHSSPKYMHKFPATKKFTDQKPQCHSWSRSFRAKQLFHISSAIFFFLLFHWNETESQAQENWFISQGISSISSLLFVISIFCLKAPLISSNPSLSRFVFLLFLFIFFAVWCLQQLVLEEVIGTTTKNNNGLASNVNSPNCVYLAGCIVVVYNVDSGTQSHLVVPHRLCRPLSCVAMSRDGRFVAAGEVNYFSEMFTFLFIYHFTNWTRYECWDNFDVRSEIPYFWFL